MFHIKSARMRLRMAEQRTAEFRKVASLVQRFQPVGLQAGGAGACAAQGLHNCRGYPR
jgi:hypothetical protein